MSERVFLDTNVLVYADDASAGPKAEAARTLIRSTVGARSAVLSTQVLQEYFVIATRKLGVAPSVARHKVELLAKLDVVQIEPTLILEAADLSALRHYSFWDSLILCSARAAGCTRVYTEDLQHGEQLGALRIENPFAGLG